jgi:hypothetical protein
MLVVEAIARKRRVSIVAHRPPRVPSQTRFRRDRHDRNAAQTDARFHRPVTKTGEENWSQAVTLIVK